MANRDKNMGKNIGKAVRVVGAVGAGIAAAKVLFSSGHLPDYKGNDRQAVVSRDSGSSNPNYITSKKQSKQGSMSGNVSHTPGAPNLNIVSSPNTPYQSDIGSQVVDHRTQNRNGRQTGRNARNSRRQTFSPVDHREVSQDSLVQGVSATDLERIANEGTSRVASWVSPEINNEVYFDYIGSVGSLNFTNPNDFIKSLVDADLTSINVSGKEVLLTGDIYDANTAALQLGQIGLRAGTIIAYRDGTTTDEVDFRNLPEADLTAKGITVFKRLDDGRYIAVGAEASRYNSLRTGPQRLIALASRITQLNTTTTGGLTIDSDNNGKILPNSIEAGFISPMEYLVENFGGSFNAQGLTAGQKIPVGNGVTLQLEANGDTSSKETFAEGSEFYVRSDGTVYALDASGNAYTGINLADLTNALRALNLVKVPDASSLQGITAPATTSPRDNRVSFETYESMLSAHAGYVKDGVVQVGEGLVLTVNATETLSAYGTDYAGTRLLLRPDTTTTDNPNDFVDVLATGNVDLPDGFTQQQLYDLLSLNASKYTLKTFAEAAGVGQGMDVALNAGNKINIAGTEYEGTLVFNADNTVTHTDTNTQLDRLTVLEQLAADTSTYTTQLRASQIIEVTENFTGEGSRTYSPGWMFVVRPGDNPGDSATVLCNGADSGKTIDQITADLKLNPHSYKVHNFLDVADGLIAVANADLTYDTTTLENGKAAVLSDANREALSHWDVQGKVQLQTFAEYTQLYEGMDVTLVKDVQIAGNTYGPSTSLVNLLRFTATGVEYFNGTNWQTVRKTVTDAGGATTTVDATHDDVRAALAQAKAETLNSGASLNTLYDPNLTGNRLIKVTADMEGTAFKANDVYVVRTNAANTGLEVVNTDGTDSGATVDDLLAGMQSNPTAYTVEGFVPVEDVIYQVKTGKTLSYDNATGTDINLTDGQVLRMTADNQEAISANLDNLERYTLEQFAFFAKGVAYTFPSNVTIGGKLYGPAPAAGAPAGTPTPVSDKIFTRLDGTIVDGAGNTVDRTQLLNTLVELAIADVNAGKLFEAYTPAPTNGNVIVAENPFGADASAQRPAGNYVVKGGRFFNRDGEDVTNYFIYDLASADPANFTGGPIEDYVGVNVGVDLAVANAIDYKNVHLSPTDRVRVRENRGLPAAAPGAPAYVLDAVDASGNLLNPQPEDEVLLEALAAHESGTDYTHKGAVGLYLLDGLEFNGQTYGAAAVAGPPAVAARPELVIVNSAGEVLKADGSKLQNAGADVTLEKLAEMIRKRTAGDYTFEDFVSVENGQTLRVKAAETRLGKVIRQGTSYIQTAAGVTATARDAAGAVVPANADENYFATPEGLSILNSLLGDTAKIVAPADSLEYLTDPANWNETNDRIGNLKTVKFTDDFSVAALRGGKAYIYDNADGTVAFFDRNNAAITGANVPQVGVDAVDTAAELTQYLLGHTPSREFTIEPTTTNLGLTGANERLITLSHAVNYQVGANNVTYANGSRILRKGADNFLVYDNNGAVINNAVSTDAQLADMLARNIGRWSVSEDATTHDPQTINQILAAANLVAGTSQPSRAIEMTSGALNGHTVYLYNDNTFKVYDNNRTEVTDLTSFGIRTGTNARGDLNAILAALPTTGAYNNQTLVEVLKARHGDYVHSNHIGSATGNLMVKIANGEWQVVNSDGSIRGKNAEPLLRELARREYVEHVEIKDANNKVTGHSTDNLSATRYSIKTIDNIDFIDQMNTEVATTINGRKVLTNGSTTFFNPTTNETTRFRVYSGEAQKLDNDGNWETLRDTDGNPDPTEYYNAFRNLKLVEFQRESASMPPQMSALQQPYSPGQSPREQDRWGVRVTAEGNAVDNGDNLLSGVHNATAEGYLRFDDWLFTKLTFDWQFNPDRFSSLVGTYDHQSFNAGLTFIGNLDTGAQTVLRPALNFFYQRTDMTGQGFARDFDAWKFQGDLALVHGNVQLGGTGTFRDLLEGIGTYASGDNEGSSFLIHFGYTSGSFTPDRVAGGVPAAVRKIVLGDDPDAILRFEDEGSNFSALELALAGVGQIDLGGPTLTIAGGLSYRNVSATLHALLTTNGATFDYDHDFESDRLYGWIEAALGFDGLADGRDYLALRLSGASNYLNGSQPGMFEGVNDFRNEALIFATPDFRKSLVLRYTLDLGSVNDIYMRNLRVSLFAGLDDLDRDINSFYAGVGVQARFGGGGNK